MPSPLPVIFCWPLVILNVQNLDPMHLEDFYDLESILWIDMAFESDNTGGIMQK